MIMIDLKVILFNTRFNICQQENRERKTVWWAGFITAPKMHYGKYFNQVIHQAHKRN